MKKINKQLNLSTNCTEHRKSLQDDRNDKTENENLCDSYTKCLDETKNETFL